MEVGRRGGRQRRAKLSVRRVSVTSGSLDAANVSLGAHLRNEDEPSGNNAEMLGRELPLKGLFSFLPWSLRETYAQALR